MTVTSPDITDLNFSVLFDVSKVPPEVVVTNLSTVVNPAALDWWFVITTPSGAPIHTGNGTTPDIDNAPFTTKTYTTWPQPMGQIEWGAPYTVTVYVKDSTGAEFSLSKKATIPRPVGSNPKVKNNFGAASVIADMRCNDAQLYVEDTTSYSWNGTLPSFPERTWILVYPLDASDVQPPDFVLYNANNALIPVAYSGPGYQIVRRVVAEYDQGNDVLVRLKYKYTKDFEVMCDVDLCGLVCEYEKMLKETGDGSCDPATTSKLVTINGLINLALIAKAQPLCGIQLGPIIDQLKELGGFTCDCGNNNTGGGGINGGGSGGSAGNITMTVTPTGGDLKVGLLTVVGSNITLEMSDVSYQFAVDKSVANSFAQALSYQVTTSPNGYIKTVTLKVDEQVVTNWMNSWMSTQPGIGAPILVDIHMKGTGAPPSNCPVSFYPVQLWTTDGLNQLPIVFNANELVAALAADPGWGALGMWAINNNCQMMLWKAPGVTTVPTIQVSDPAPIVNCANNKQDYIIELNQQACGKPMPAVLFPCEILVSYLAGTPKYYLGLVTGYNDMVNKLQAEPHKPAHISFAGVQNHDTWIIVHDTDCAQGTLPVVEPYVTEELFYAVATGQNAGTISGAFLMDGVGPTEKAIVCGSPTASENPWHSIRIGNLMYYVCSQTGNIHRVDISNPMNPIHTGTTVLTATVAGHNALGNLPAYAGGDPSWYDVYFHTDLNTTGGGFLYIVESVSGYVWKYSLVSDTVVGSDWNAALVGRCPRVIHGGNLICSLDGSRAADTGQTATNSHQLVGIYLASISNTAGSTTVTPLGGLVAAGTDQIWALSWDGKRSCMWATSRNGTLLKVSYGGGLLATYAGAWNTNFVGMCNTHIFGDRIYASDMGSGTRWIDLNNPGIFATAFEPLVLNGVTVNKHYNFIVPVGACYGIVTADNDRTTPNKGLYAKYTLDGKLLSVTQGIVFGNVYNLIPIYNTKFGYPNGLCQ